MPFDDTHNNIHIVIAASTVYSPVTQLFVIAIS